MKITAAVAVLAMMGGCGASALGVVNGTALGVSTATLACDWGQTHKAAAAGWRGSHEANPIMGPTPSTTVVNVYFLVAIAANAGIWILTPRKYRAILPTIVAARETYSIVGNHDARVADLSGCGVAPGMM